MATQTQQHLHTTASQSPAVSVVTPAYNEAASLGQLAGDTVDVLSGLDESFELIIVDDGSTDDTETQLHHVCNLFEEVRAVQLMRNFGQSAALAAGIEAAQGDVIVTMDADLQNDPADIPDLLATLQEGYDCVSGHRVDRDDPLTKRIPSRIQTYLAKHTGPDIHDFGCTLTAYRAEALADIDLYGEGHRYIPSKLYDKGYSITEQPVNHRPRENGNSHYGLSRLVRGFVDLLFHWFWVRFSTRPIHLLGGAGLVALGLGGAIGAVSLLQRFVFGVPLDPRTPRLILTALLITFGLQLVVFGVLAEMLTKLHYRDEPAYRVERVIE